MFSGSSSNRDSEPEELLSEQSTEWLVALVCVLGEGESLAKQGAALALRDLDQGYDEAVLSHDAVPKLIKLARSNEGSDEPALEALERFMPFMVFKEPDSICNPLQMLLNLLADTEVSFRLRSCAAFSLGNMLSSMKSSSTPLPTSFPVVSCIQSLVEALQTHPHQGYIVSPWLWPLFNIDFTLPRNRTGLEQAGGVRQLVNFLDIYVCDDNLFMALQLVLSLVSDEHMALAFAREGLVTTLLSVAGKNKHCSDVKAVCLRILQFTPTL